MGINFKETDLIYPYFVVGGTGKKVKIKSFPDTFRYSVDRLLKDIENTGKLGLNKILLFGIPDAKDNLGSAAYGKGNIVSYAVSRIKREFPALIVMTDVCLCAYTAHGHCGILERDGRKIEQKGTLNALSKTALSHAEAGADWVAPSAMAKRQVSAIRHALDKNGYKKTKIMGYSAKFASNFYGPFRNAADSAPRSGDRSGYQLDYADLGSALKEIEDDVREGADMVMVKPALSYLDVIREAKLKSPLPLAAYNVSGEYAMVKYGAKQGLWDEKKIVFEIMSSIKRAGADFIITYHAKEIAGWLKEKDH